MGCRSDPFTSIFSNIGKVTPYVAEQNSAISLAAPGSCPPNWLHGNPTTAKPREPSSSCSFSSAVYCGVSPHLEATFTTRRVLPSSEESELSEESCPVRVFTGMSRMVTQLRYRSRAPHRLAEVASRHRGDERVHRVLVRRQRSGQRVRRGQPALDRLARPPVLPVGQVPELHRVPGVEVRPRHRLRRERPGALDPRPV